MGVFSGHNHLRMTVSLVGRLRMTGSVISPQLSPMIIFGCIWLVWFLQRKKCLASSFPCTGIHRRKVPMASIEETGAAKDGVVGLSNIQNLKLISRHFVVLNVRRWYRMLNKIQQWKHSQGWRNSCTHGGWLFHTCIWMFYTIIFRFIVTSRKNTWGKLMYIWTTWKT